MENKGTEIKNKRNIAAFSLAVSIVLVAGKITAALLSNSLGVFSEALNNGLDLVTVFITFMAIRMSTRPADRDHTYGHGKYENFSAFIEVAVITGLGIFIIYKSVSRLIHRDFELNISWPVFLILGLSLVLNIVRVAILRNSSRKYHSFAFRAEIVNYSGDILSSVVVLAGLVFARMGIWIADPLASIAVALLVIVLSIRLSISIIRNLLDYIPIEVTEKIRGTIKKVKEVKEVNELKIHEVGGIKFINANISVSSNFYLSQVERIKDEVRDRIRRSFPNSQIIVEIKPCLSDENITEKIKNIALNQNDIGDVHDVFVYPLGEYMDASLHVKLARDMNLKEVEKLTRHTEKQLKENIKILRRVYVHAEDISTEEGWEDATGQSEELIRNIKKEISAYIDPQSCHKFTILRKNNRYNASFHCEVDSRLSIEEAHKLVTEAEGIIRKKIQEIEGVLIHVEPRGYE